MQSQLFSFLIDEKTFADNFIQVRDLLQEKISIVILYKAYFHALFFFDFFFEPFLKNVCFYFFFCDIS